MNTLIYTSCLGLFCLLAEILNLRKLLIPAVVIAITAIFGVNYMEWNQGGSFYNDMVRYAYVGARHEDSVSSMKPYYLLLWEAIKIGCREGYAIMDYGGATQFTNDGGLYAFKEQWSDKKIAISSYFYLNKSKTLPDVNKSAFTLASKVWKKMPLSAVKALSPFAIKQFV